MNSVMHMIHGVNHRLEMCGQWVVDRLHISRVREGFKKSRKGGFTLVELMVVVAVIAILAAIAMPQFLSAADKARNAKETADIQIIKNATQLYMIDKNVDTPPTVENLYKEGYLTEHVKTAKGKEELLDHRCSRYLYERCVLHLLRAGSRVLGQDDQHLCRRQAGGLQYRRCLPHRHRLCHCNAGHLHLCHQEAHRFSEGIRL